MQDRKSAREKGRRSWRAPYRRELQAISEAAETGRAQLAAQVAALAVAFGVLGACLLAWFGVYVYFGHTGPGLLTLLILSALSFSCCAFAGHHSSRIRQVPLSGGTGTRVLDCVVTKADPGKCKATVEGDRYRRTVRAEAGECRKGRRFLLVGLPYKGKIVPVALMPAPEKQ